MTSRVPMSGIEVSADCVHWFETLSLVSVMNQPSVRDWVVQVPLWPSGLGVGLWNRRPGFDPRTVRYTY